MARSAPYADSYDAQHTDGADEWSVLRSELAGLIDQVETRLLGHAAEQPARRRMESPAARERGDGDPRHADALRSVRRAVDRFSDRAAPEDSARSTRQSAEIAEAIGQIRARQGVQPALQRTPDGAPRLQRENSDMRRRDREPALRDTRWHDEAPRPRRAEPAQEAAFLAETRRALRDMSGRIEQFESRFSRQIADLGSNRDVSEQVAQLAEVVEMLARAVGENTPMRQIESRIAHLADAVAHAPASEDAAILAKLDQLSRLVSELSENQADLGASQDAASRYADATMQFFEDSVRGIYERIDALDAARASQPEELERLSLDLAALVRTLDDRDERAQNAINGRFSALEDRIETLRASEPSGAEALREAVATLRSAVQDSLEPRFSALEDRLDGLARDVAATPALDGADITAQLRRINDKIDATSAQVDGLLVLARNAADAGDGPDLSALADMVAERTRAGLPGQSLPDAEALADLVAERMPAPGPVSARMANEDINTLAARLSHLFADTKGGAGETAPLDRIGETIANVDARLAQIEATLNAQQATPSPAPASPLVDDATAFAPAPRYVRPDTMPRAPGSDDPLPLMETSQGGPAIADPLALLRTDETVARRATPAAPRAAATVETPGAFRIDPETIARPERPVSSLDAGESSEAPAASVLPERRVEPAVQARSGDGPAAVNRASFIEAARRAARHHDNADDAPPPRSLIGRALARFQSSEAAREAGGEAGAPARPVADPAISRGKAHKDDSPALAEPGSVAVTETIADAIPPLADDGAGTEGFLRRHRRPLLLGTGLVIVLLLAANVVSQRLLPGTDEPVAPMAMEAQQDGADVAPAMAGTPVGEATPPAAADPDRSPMMSGLTDPRPAGDQIAELAFTPGGADLLSGDMIDPMTTAAIGPQAGAPVPAVTAPMPIAVLPEDVGPEGLRAAAEAGDMRAQFEVAALLTEGLVVEQDLAQAAAWYERAAAQGFAPAQYRLGNLYESGQGVSTSLEQARLWYQRAAEAGNRMSMHNLASLYASGQLDTQDFAAAAHWFEQAATRGMTDSQFNLGMLHARGLGVGQSFESSYLWFSLAAASGDADAAQARDDVARSLDVATIQRLDEEIAAWRPAAIDMEANFAPIGTWDGAFDAGQPIANREVVQRVQELLAKLGYTVGTPDGLAGPLTREAIASFERDTGMSETGAVNPRLLAVLGSQPV